jgi:molybdenum cofactor cytidylyltransferase
VAPYALRSVGVISTRLLGIKPFVIGMTLAVLEERLEPANARIIQTCRVPHEGRL